MKQQREVLRKEKETAEKIAARAFAQSYLADLVPTVFGTLSDNGYFYDPVERGTVIFHLSVLDYFISQGFMCDWIIIIVIVCTHMLYTCTCMLYASLLK